MGDSECFCADDGYNESFPFFLSLFSPPPLPFLLHVCQDANAQTDADTSVPRTAMQAEWTL